MEDPNMSRKLLMNYYDEEVFEKKIIFDKIDANLVDGPLCRYSGLIEGRIGILAFNRVPTRLDIYDIISVMYDDISNKNHVKKCLTYMMGYEALTEAHDTVQIISEHPAYAHYVDVLYQATDNLRLIKECFISVEEDLDDISLDYRMIKNKLAVRISTPYDPVLEGIRQKIGHWTRHDEREWFMTGGFYLNYMLPFHTFHPLGRVHALGADNGKTQTKQYVGEGFFFTVTDHFPAVSEKEVYELLHPPVGSLVQKSLLLWEVGTSAFPSLWRYGDFPSGQLDNNIPRNMREAIMEILMRQDPNTGMSYMAWAQDPVLGPVFCMFECIRNMIISSAARQLIPWNSTDYDKYDFWSKYFTVQGHDNTRDYEMFKDKFDVDSSDSEDDEYEEYDSMRVGFESTWSN
jgi:hypothetical protein